MTKQQKWLGVFLVSAALALGGWVFDTNVRYGNITATGVLKVGGGSALATTNQSGTGSLCMTTSCALATPALTTPTITNPTTTGTDNGAEIVNNKTLDSAGSGNAVNLLNSQVQIVGLIGNSADQTVYTFTIPANTVQAGKGIRIKMVGFHSAGAAAISYKIIIGSTTTATISTADNNVENWSLSIYNAGGVQNSQVYEATMLGAGNSVLVNTFGTAVENFANAITVKFTFNVANTDQYTGKLWAVELIQ